MISISNLTDNEWPPRIKMAEMSPERAARFIREAYEASSKIDWDEFEALIAGTFSNALSAGFEAGLVDNAAQNQPETCAELQVDTSCTGQIAALHKILREVAIQQKGSIGTCMACKRSWFIGNEENHTTECLARKKKE